MHPDLRPQSPGRVLRIAHLTDIHVQPELLAAKGMEACLAHVQAQPDKPDIIFTGGDLIMDALGASRDRVKTQWDIFGSVLKANLELQIRHCVGNHDVWGWNDRAKYRGEHLFGKQWAKDALELESTYYSFDQAGWHFIVLDSTHPLALNGYTAKLDEEQFLWLEDDLANTPHETPIFVLSHIPIISACAYFDGNNEASGDWAIPGMWMHIDARRIKDLFAKHSNVQLCVSGHIHLVDQVLYNGVNYCCNGAVCADWWKGDYQECTFGYALIDLYSDGSFFNRYVPFDWSSRK